MGREVARLASVTRRVHGRSRAAAANTADISVIVPTWRDTPAAGQLLAAARQWSPAPREIVVVSGEADPALARLCAEHGGRYLESSTNRGAQLDLGAHVATGRVLWFLHADAAVPSDALEAINRTLAAGAESGCFRFAFQGGPTWYKRLLEESVALRVQLGGVAYGDQALFVTRDAYEACAGFDHQPLFEEVRLIKRLRRRGTFHVLREHVGVSTRRWERDGWLRRTLQNRWLAARYALGTPAERLAAAYVRADTRFRDPPA